MRVQINRPRAGSPEKIAAEVEIFFDADGPLAHLKLTGITIWKSDDPERGDYYVTMPARPTQAKAGGGRGADAARYYDFLRSADAYGTPEGKAAIARFKNRLVATYKRDGIS